MVANGYERTFDQVTLTALVMNGTERPAGGNATGMVRNRRQIYEARQYRRSVTIACISTALVLAAIIVLVPLAPGWERVKASSEE